MIVPDEEKPKPCKFNRFNVIKLACGECVAAATIYSVVAAVNLAGALPNIILFKDSKNG